MKYKGLKRATGILLSVILMLGSLSGCSGKENVSNVNGGNSDKNPKDKTEEESKETAMGRFLEEEIILPTEFYNIYDMKKLEDGTVRFIGTDGNGIDGAWESKDTGNSWEKVYDFPKELQDEEKGYIDYATLSLDGQTVCVFNEIGKDSIIPICYLMDKSGNLSKIPFELQKVSKEDGSVMNAFTFSKEVSQEEGNENNSTQTEEESKEKNSENMSTNMILDIKFLGKDQILVKDVLDTIYQVNISDGTVKQKYEFDGMIESHQFFVAGTMLIVQTSSEILFYNTETGEQQNIDESLQKIISESGNFSAIDTLNMGESMYCLSRNGLYHYKFGGSLFEQLIDGTMNSMSGPAFYGLALTMLDEQNLLVAANDTYSDSLGGIVILKYTYSADTPVKPEKELKVYSLYDNKELRQSISRFQKEHSEVYVNVEVALSEENGVTTSDALKTLTTEIMAGKGPDVLILDGMPVETYIEKGILKDLSSVIEKSKGNYFESILEAYKDKQGQLCAVTARFMIPVIQAGSAYYTPGENFDTFMERKDTLLHMKPKDVIEKFWYSCSVAWKKEDGTLDAEKMKDFLSKLKNAYGEYDSSMDEEEYSVSYSMEGSAPSNVNILQNLSIGKGSFDLAFGRLNTNIGLFGGGDYDFMLAVNKRLEGGNFGHMPGQVENVFVPSMIMGISSKSIQTEVAEQFVKYLFTPEAQKISQGGGFPVDKDAFRSTNDGHQYKENDSLVAVGGVSLDEMIDYEMKPRTEEEMKKLIDLAEEVKIPALQDGVIKDAVTEYGEKVLKGEMEPQEATNAIMQKVNIYLAE